MDALSLFTHLEAILIGLLGSGIQVVSYACDGTEVGRNVQKLLVSKASHKQDYLIPNPNPGSPEIKISIPFINNQPICMVQDSKHALKTYRNNLFSGARLLVFGNYYAQYEQIHQIAREKGSPLYIRDVERLDRQDDNAATRLFSADTLQYINDNHPEWIGVIVYLFVFGELVDAYQNRFLPHQERIKMVLRARFYLDAWERFVASAKYKKAQHFISREASDITRIIVDGFLGLVYIYRDHIGESKTIPFIPWLHSTEVCEHVFGVARQIIKDFTAFDFFQMIPKLRVQLRRGMSHDASHNSKARASGYAHTYMDTKGMDIRALCTFPSDEDIAINAEQAACESESLIALLGVSVEQLYGATSFMPLPSISAWYSTSTTEIDEQDAQEINEAPDLEAQELQEWLELWESAETSKLPLACKKRVTDLTCAALAVATDEAITM